MMTSDEIREAFLTFFEERGHQRAPSSSLIPRADPTLLFVNAGMVQFKDVFLGAESRSYSRATTSQKCVRAGGKHNDLNSVGRTARHHTFFEMLGNFSFGDYFKRDAITYAWTFLTGVLKLPKEDLWVSIYEEDDEAGALWQEIAGIATERIVRLGEHDNFWAMGDTGPCGPCSEIHVDRGEAFRCDAPVCAVGVCDCDRWLEIWNLVFMQFNRDENGVMTPLPKPSIDTGMGLERITAVMQNARTNYDTDLLRPLIDRVAQLSGVPYSEGESGFPHRVIADHARACAFLIGDGVLPGNEGRGYVLRRILRRAIRLGRKLGLTEPFMGTMADAVIARMGAAYPDIMEKRDFIKRVLELEEERFGQTLTTGLDLLGSYISYTSAVRINFLGGMPRPFDEFKYIPASQNFLINLGIRLSYFASRLPEAVAEELINPIMESLNGFVQNEASDTYRELRLKLEQFAYFEQSGRLAFILHDTYGFPYELTEEIAAEHGLSVDRAGFEREMEAQRARARAAQKGGPSTSRSTLRVSDSMSSGRAAPGIPFIDYEELPLPPSQFLGYQTLSAEGIVQSLSTPDGAAEEAVEGQEVEVVLDRTPFYAAGGGQVGDQGVLIGPSGRVRVTDTQKAGRGLYVHKGIIERRPELIESETLRVERLVEGQGSIAVGETVTATVDLQRRADIARNHTGTHLLHAALRKVLGSHVQQAGSLVSPDRLRFDFSHIAPMTRDEMDEVQRLVNEKIREDWPVQPRTSSYQQAIDEGALAFFDDKYGEVVRIVEVFPPKNGRPHLPHESATDPTALTGRRSAFSKELCGGTHCGSTGEVGMLVILGESSIGSGMRRIEAVTGRAAEEMLRQRMTALDDIGRQVSAPAQEAPSKVLELLQSLEQERRRAQALQRELNRRLAEDLMERVAAVDGVKHLSARVAAPDFETLREMADLLRDKMQSGVIVLGALFNERPNFLAVVTKDLVTRGYNAGSLVKEVAAVTGGSGGGRPELAQAGGRDASKLDEALQRVPDLVRSISAR